MGLPQEFLGELHGVACLFDGGVEVFTPCPARQGPVEVALVLVIECGEFLGKLECPHYPGIGVGFKVEVLLQGRECLVAPENLRVGEQ